MTHFDLITTSGEIWRDVIANEMESMNLQEAWLLRRDEVEEIDRRLVAAGQEPISISPRRKENENE